MRKADYLPEGAAPSSIPAGKVLVHNHVVAGIKPDRRVGTYGFRAWWADKPAGKDLECCDCGWKPDLGTHYRVRH
jgi:hypothetical protein